MRNMCVLLAALFLCLTAVNGNCDKVAWRLFKAIDAPEANQAAAALGNHIYAINSKFIVRYDRESGSKIDQSSGAAAHLNSGFFLDGKLYCAHSNFPRKPDRSDIKVLDPQTMQLSVFKDLGETDGSLTWVVRHENKWWCTFAFYGQESNAKTYLARFDDNWHEERRWFYPSSVVVKLGKNSVSGGLWRDDNLLVCGHDAPELYCLSLPQQNNTLIHRETLSVPFKGQGFALDPVTGGLLGIDRKAKTIIMTTLSPGKTRGEQDEKRFLA